MKKGNLSLLLGSLATAILVGCTAASPASPTVSAPTQPATAVITPAEQATPTALPSATAAATAVAATATSTAEATSTAMPATLTPAPQPSANRVAVQLVDNSVAWVDAAGKVTPLAKVPVSLANSTFAAAIANDTVFGYSVGLPPGAFAVNATGAQALRDVGQNLVGVAAWPGAAPADAQVAWGTFTTTAEGAAIANLLIGKSDGSALHTALTDTAPNMLFTLLPLHWAADGKTLYYSSEPTGLGGYILFSGFSGLYKLDTTTGVTTTLIPRGELGFICLDDLSPNLDKVASHCGEKAIHILDLTTNQTTTINIPATVTDSAALGSTSFSPDGSRVAYALARHNPDNEQGWLAVSDSLAGDSHLIYTSPAGTYASVAGWLDADTVVFQVSSLSGQSNTPNTVWAVSADGSNLRKLAEGNVLAVAPATATPATQGDSPGGIAWRQENGTCQTAQLDTSAVRYGACGNTLTQAGYLGPTTAAAYTYFLHTYASFTAQTPAGSIIFTGTGQTIATSAEQRMIAEFAKLAAQEAAAGRSSAADQTALAWHREGGIAGFCDDIVVSVYGYVSATSCRSQKAQALGTRWLSASQAQQLYAWLDLYKTFTQTHDKPVQPDELVITGTFNGRGAQDITSADQQAIMDFAQQLRNQVAKP